MPNKLTIVHRPTGIDHPYEPFFNERRPRDPSCGDMVVLGFLTKPGHAAEQTRVEWTRNGKAQATIHARALERNDVEDRWLVELGFVEARDHVEYRITVSDATGNEITTDRHGFVTRSWHVAAGATPVAAGEGESRFALVGARGEQGPNLIVVPDIAGGGVTFRFEPGSAGPSGELKSDHVSATGQILLAGNGETPLPVTVRWQDEGGRTTAIELTGPLGQDEVLTGFGERFESLNQNGRSPDVVVYEQYKNQGNRTYLPIPFFLSNKGYGLLGGGTTKVSFDIGKTVPDRWRCLFEVPASGSLDVHAFSGQPDRIVRSLTARTGRPEPLPLWAYGLWMSSNEWNTQARVEREVALTQQHQIPATVVVIEAWSDESTFYIWNGAEYAPRSGDHLPKLSDFSFPEHGPWPDPAGMTCALHDAGIRLVLWQIPALKHIGEPHPQQDADVDHAVANGFVLQNEDGTPYRNPFFWFRDGMIPDFTSQAATEWWLSKRAYLLDEIGIDGFKTDGSEHLAGRGIRASDGRRGDELVNAFPNLYIDAYYKFAREHRNGDALTFSRAGHTGAGSMPAHWAGDENSTWEAYRRSIVAGLTAGLSGVIFWGWDIAGFGSDLPSAELYLRSAAMAAFCPIMQYHSEYNDKLPSRDRTPWNVAAGTGDERAISLFRFFACLRMSFLPYIAQEAAYAAEHGTPLMRALMLDFPDDPVCWEIDDQYCFGRSLLIAPVVEEGATTRTLYLPAGTWIDLWSGKTLAGGDWITVDAPLDRIPLFAREGTVIPLRFGAAGRLGDDTGNGLSLTDGLVYWLAVGGDKSRSGADMLSPVTFERGDDGRIEVEIGPSRHPVRVMKAGGDPVTAEPSRSSRRITLS